MPTADELINFAIGQQPTKFASAFDDIMGAKAIAAIDDMRTNVAQGIYAAEEDDQDGVETEDDIDDDIDDDEFDDIDDIDLEDEDFDDTDLEGLDDGEDA